MNPLLRLLARLQCLRLLAQLFLLAAAASPAFAITTHSDNGDGTMTDPTTGLVWMRCSMGQTWDGTTCTDTEGIYSWDQANALTGTVNFAGHNDWRLPNIRELQTIADQTVNNPAIDLGAFPNTPASGFWSASAYAHDSVYAWLVVFDDGYTGFDKKGDYNQVRLVRSGQHSGLLGTARPNSDYVDQGDGTVTHTPTGLMWQRCAFGQSWTGSTCSGTPTEFTWDEANQLTIRFAGKTDWRLPTQEELLSLVDYGNSYPATNGTLFPNTTSTGFWSASAYAGDSANAWSVDFSDGMENVYARDSAGLIRFVRDGQSFDLLPGWNLVGNAQSQPITVVALLGDPVKVTSVWKWDVLSSGWQFYAPALAATALQSYATTKGYGVLTTIQPGEGFWVNANSAFSQALPNGALVAPVSFQIGKAGALTAGWSLVSIGTIRTPSGFNADLSASPPLAGAVPINLTTLWAWNNPLGKWYFFAPNLEAQGGTALFDYTVSKGYLDFTATGRTLGNGMGFWVNKQ